MGHKSSGSHKRSKDKHKKSKDKKHKSKSKKRSRKEYSSSSSSGYSSDGDAHVDVNTSLAMGRAAVRAAREILAYKYELRNDLRELARQLDNGGAINISGIPDDFLRTKLNQLLENLVQLKKSSSGQYLKRSGSAAVLSFLAPILEETPATLASYAPKPPNPSNTSIPETAAAVAEDAGQDEQEAIIGPEIGPSLPHEGAVLVPNQQQQEEEEQEGLVEDFIDESDHDGDTTKDGLQPEAVVGAAAPLRRVLGPAMPPPEVLAAAAAMAPVDDDYGHEDEHNEDEEENFLVGPMPIELEEEVDAASMDERTAEVVRVLKVLREHETSTTNNAALMQADAPGAAPAPVPPDPYLVLGVEPNEPTGAIKKKYWKLSLLIHPDKCSHESAPTAFQAVVAAATVLQDAASRAAADERREDAELRRMAVQHVAQLERERQWRIARGEGTAADLAGPAAVASQFSKPSRETWMTDLPPENSGPRGLSQKSQTAFSARAVGQRGDVSAWTMTPQQRALQLEGGGGNAGGGPALLTGGDTSAMGRSTQHTAAAAAVDAYNAGARSKSLMEIHQEKIAKESGKESKKKKKKAQKTDAHTTAGGSAAGDDWDKTAHPWRPFDREKDLALGSSKSKADPNALLQGMPSLKGKFSGSNTGQRTFL